MKHLRFRAVAMTATMVGALLSAGIAPALADDCSSQGCGDAKNNSLFASPIADRCSNDCGPVTVPNPGEISPKHRVVTDVFAL
jgi:hypothetical protein